MFRPTCPRPAKPAKLHCRTTPSVLIALQAEALRQNRSLSELLHIILCEHFGIDPATGLRVAAGPGDPPGSGGPAGLAS